MKHRIELHPAQYKFVTSQERFTAFIGGIGSGKTFAGAVKGLLHAKPGTLGLVVAPTYPMLRDATARTYQQLAGNAMQLRLSDMRAIIRVPGGTAEILFRSATEPDRFRGINAHWAHIDEAALCPEATWDIVIGRLRADGQAGPCWITTTPKGKANWVYKRLPLLTVFKASTEDNPYLSPEYIASLKEAYTGPFAKQELEGEFVSYEGLVYEMFSRDIHVKERSAEWREVVAGVDFGYTNPTAVLVIGFDSDDRAHVLEEFYRRQVTLDELVRVLQDLKERHKIKCFYCDPSEPGIIATLRRSGIPATDAKTSSVLDGIRHIQARLNVAGDGKPRLTVSPSCVYTIAEFETYMWREGKDEPLKVNDHAMDALRYALAASRYRGRVIILEG